MKKHLSKIRSSIFLTSILFVTISCKNEDPVDKDLVCGVADPVKNLKWLNDEFNAFVGGPEINGIVLYNYNGNPVIEVQSGLFSSTNIHQYSCEGIKLNLEDPKAFKEFRDKRTEVKMLYGTKMW